MEFEIRYLAGDCQSSGQIIIQNPLDKRIYLTDRIYPPTIRRINPDFILLHITVIISADPVFINFLITVSAFIHTTAQPLPGENCHVVEINTAVTIQVIHIIPLA